MKRGRPSPVAPATALVLSLVAMRAHAGDPALAQSLFDEGKRLYADGEIERACEKFAGSHEADPSVGALLNLARCHQKAGKNASAWAEYREAAGLARREGQDKRRKGALALADAIEPSLSRLEIVVADPAPGLEVRRGDEVVPTSAYAVAVPVDPGTYVVEASAPGMRTWLGEVTVAADGDRVVLRIPALEPSPDATPDGGPSTAGAGLDGLDIGAIASGSVGLACLAVGGALGAIALSQRDDLADRCGSDGVCEAPIDLAAERADIESVAHGSTAMFVVGGVGLGAAATMLVLSALGEPSEPELAFSVGEQGAWLGWRRRF